MKSTIVWDLTPCNPLKVHRRFGGTYRLHLQGWKITRARNHCENMWQAENFFDAGFFPSLFSTLKIEAIYSSETSVDFQRTTWRYISEDSTLQDQCTADNAVIPIYKLSGRFNLNIPVNTRKCLDHSVYSLRVKVKICLCLTEHHPVKK
jgi:hypothetical protein